MNPRIPAATAVMAFVAALAAMLASPAQTQTAASVGKTPPPSDAPAYYFEEPWVSHAPAQARAQAASLVKTPPPSDAPAYYFEEPWVDHGIDGDASHSG